MASYFLKTTGQVSVTFVENRFYISTVVVLESCNNNSHEVYCFGDCNLLLSGSSG